MPAILVVFGGELQQSIIFELALARPLTVSPRVVVAVRFRQWDQDRLQLYRSTLEGRNALGSRSLPLQVTRRETHCSVDVTPGPASLSAPAAARIVTASAVSSIHPFLFD